MTPVRSPEAGPVLLAGPATAPPVAPLGSSVGDDDAAPGQVLLVGHAPARRSAPHRPRPVILTAALAGALLAAGTAFTLQPGGTSGVPTVKITARYSRFEPDRVKVEPGSTVRFVIHNADPIDHEFIIGPAETHDIHERGEPHFHTGAVPGEVTVPAGATVETTWTFPPAGGDAVAYGCHLAGHWDYGMHGRALLS